MKFLSLPVFVWFVVIVLKLAKLGEPAEWSWANILLVVPGVILGGLAAVVLLVIGVVLVYRKVEPMRRKRSTFNAMMKE